MSRRFLKRSIFWPVLILIMAVAAMLGLALSRMPAQANALQIRPVRAGISLPDGFYVYQNLSQRGIRINSITPFNDGLIVQLDSVEQRKLAENALRDILPKGFLIQYVDPPHSKAWIEKLNRDKLTFG